MAGRLDGKVAVITGAGQGIGRGVARRYAREGAKVVVAEMNPETGPRTVGEVEALGSEAIFVPTDVSVKEQAFGCVQAAVDQWGRIDVLVNNAWGGGTISRFEWKTDAELEHGVRTGFLSNFWTMQAAFPHMKRQGGGSIVNLCSLNGVNAHMFSLEYNTAKEAVRAMTRTAAVEWGRHQIRSNAICPAAATEAYVAFRDANPETAQEMLKENPMHRMGDPEEDIGGVALFLASDDSRYVNGNTIFVDGGAHVNGVSWRPDMPEELPGA
ncbi:MAG: SDR family oxidoreductase [Acidimicrobiales bacterium]|jgi:NAD(P)-dependent dehydrogenase (short-subunit alcohol dehydrogenase family)|nr:SDR family oxidoreductase [Acidimicrobiales bacterium]